MIYIGSDHAGFIQKQKLVEYLKKKNIPFEDVGTNSTESTDYPIYAKKVCEHIKTKDDLGVLVCGSGIGMSMVANKYKHIRACLAVNKKMAYLGRHHNNANVLVLQGRNKLSICNIRILKTFLKESFDGGRHIKRLEMFSTINNEEN